VNTVKFRRLFQYFGFAADDSPNGCTFSGNVILPEMLEICGNITYRQVQRKTVDGGFKKSVTYRTAFFYSVPLNLP